MENFKNEFLAETLVDLNKLSQKISAESFDEKFASEVFRFFHTIKGTSQVLGFSISAKFAHQLENLLSAAQKKQIPINEKFFSLLREGTEILRTSLQHSRDEKSFAFPADFVEKLQDFLPTKFKLESKDFLEEIPDEIFEKLSVQEKEFLNAALADGKFFYSFEAEFDLTDFSGELIKLREIIRHNGEIIATFPSSNHSGKSKIGFRIYLVSRKNSKEISERLRIFPGNLNSLRSAPVFSQDLQGTVQKAVFVGEKTARRLGKKIDFEIAEINFNVSKKYLKVISDSLLHLIRNAADHAFEKEGKIKIEVLNQNRDIVLRVSDDGKGLDAEKIYQRACELNPALTTEELTPEKISELIFASGFSTAETISEISGRGVGLDAVRHAVENANGQVRVKRGVEKGTIFEILLPNN